ncbi:hypothetical protein ABZ470_39385 [Streptosporangium sp. NPDC020072]|uniref:hypothetical protein n=1 Tax=Streptosporangium sp. NPDC020072 TaxID=3154788 RepID=UPI0034315208
MTEQQPKTLQEALHSAFAQLAEAFGYATEVGAAQGAMGWAYNGQEEKLNERLKTMSPEQLERTRRAAHMVRYLCDAEESQRLRKR